MTERARTERYPRIGAAQVGWLSEADMIEVDRVMIDELHIELIQMMENAGRNLARLVVDRYAPATVTVLAGSGGNGGGGMVTARHLANYGIQVRVTTSRPGTELTGIPGHQFDILAQMADRHAGVNITSQPTQSDVVIDALIGYSLKGAPRGRVAELIAMIPELGDTVVSLDTPSGLNVTDGSVPGDAVSAGATLTLALPKIGLRQSPNVGELYVGDISVPPSVYAQMNITGVPDFAQGPIHHVT